ncbi:hypothetical protein SCO38_02020 [Legionella pneumophila serogroup 1]
MDYLKNVFHNFSFKDFCDLLVGVGTILIGIMGYRLSRKEYVPLIKARFNNIIFSQPGVNVIDKDSQHALSINACNEGKREIQITGVIFKFYKYPLRRGIPCHDAYILASQYHFSTKLPRFLKDGDSLVLVYPPDIFKTYRFNNETLLNACFLITLFRVMSLKIYLYFT